MSSTSGINIKDKDLTLEEAEVLFGLSETEIQDLVQAQLPDVAPSNLDDVVKELKDSVEKIIKNFDTEYDDMKEGLKDFRGEDKKEARRHLRELDKDLDAKKEALKKFVESLEEEKTEVEKHFIDASDGNDVNFNDFETNSNPDNLYVINAKVDQQADLFGNNPNAAPVPAAQTPAAVDPLADPSAPPAPAAQPVAAPLTSALPQTVTLQFPPSHVGELVPGVTPFTFKITNREDGTTAFVEIRGNPKIVIAGNFPENYRATITQWPEELQKRCYLAGQTQSFYERITGKTPTSEADQAISLKAKAAFDTVWGQVGTEKGVEGEGNLSLDNPSASNPQKIYDVIVQMLLEGKTLEEVTEVLKNGSITLGIDGLNQENISVIARVVVAGLFQAGMDAKLVTPFAGQWKSLINYDAGALYGGDPITATPTPEPLPDGAPAPLPVEKNLGTDKLSARDKAIFLLMGDDPTTALIRVKDEAGRYEENIAAINIASQLGGLKGADVPGLIKAENDAKAAEIQQKLDTEQAHEDAVNKADDALHLEVNQEMSLMAFMADWDAWDPTTNGVAAKALIDILKNTENLSVQDLKYKIMEFFQTGITKDLQGDMAFWLIAGLVKFAPKNLANVLFYNRDGMTNDFVKSLFNYANSGEVLGYETMLSSAHDFIAAVKTDNLRACSTGRDSGRDIAICSLEPDLGEDEESWHFGLLN